MSNGAEVEEDAPWKEDEPNDAGDGEGCILSSMDGGWNDIGCTKKGYAVCQKPGTGIPRFTLLMWGHIKKPQKAKTAEIEDT